jgi:hypothetical protein
MEQSPPLARCSLEGITEDHPVMILVHYKVRLQHLVVVWITEIINQFLRNWS